VALREDGIPAYREIEAAVASLARLTDLGTATPLGVPALPGQKRSSLDGAGYFEARSLLAATGVQFADASRVESLEDARTAAAEIGYPVVLKALGLLHKSDGGGVALGIGDEAALSASFSVLTTTLSPEAYSVERTAPVADGVELIVGSKRDPRFGPIVLAGFGGVYAELLRDVAVALAPAEPDEIETLLRSLEGAPLLLGARGRPPVDLAAAARAAAALSRLAAAHPELAEIEINPLLVTPDGALGLDARIVLREEGDADAR
jgi:acyl-CoA synthetase (NDP forming)